MVYHNSENRTIFRKSGIIISLDLRLLKKYVTYDSRSLHGSISINVNDNIKIAIKT